MSRNSVRTAALALGVALPALLLASPVAASGDSSRPQLSISIDDGMTSANVGDTLTYVITIDNLGSSHVRKLHVSQSMPGGLDVLSANHRAVKGAAGLAWSVVDLAPGGHLTLRTTSKVGRTPGDQLRLATVACAALSPTTSPIVCATDSDELPAGAAARVSAAPGGGEHAGGSGGTAMSTPLVAGLAGLLLLIVAGLGTFKYRLRGAHASP
jgi:uncharacterized repeat protein (TIGR01451 family)